MLFSIVIPTYNRASFLSIAIQSVIAQQYIHWELIVVDDGSTDQTKAVVEGFADARIRYIYQTNAERSIARNNGIALAKGAYICFLDSDDYYLPTHLSELYQAIAMASSKKAFFTTRMYLETEGGERKKTSVDISFTHPARSIFWTTKLNPNTVCIHKDLFLEHRFPEQFNIWEDTHLWVRLASLFPFYQLNAYTVVQKEHAQRGVTTDLQAIHLPKINTYIACIQHLFTQYASIISSELSEKDKIRYIDAKYDMFIYQCRLGRQPKKAISLLWLKLKNNPSIKTLIQVKIMLLKLLYERITYRSL